jgi:hypothetical protein
MGKKHNVDITSDDGEPLIEGYAPARATPADLGGGFRLRGGGQVGADLGMAPGFGYDADPASGDRGPAKVMTFALIGRRQNKCLYGYFGDF